MKAETIIKQQARNSLADQNWGVALAAFIFPACAFFMAQTVNSFSVIVRGASVEELANAPFARPEALLFFLLLQVLAVGILFVFSPVFVGAAKLYTDIAHGRQGRLSTLFGWFSGKHQYGRAVVFSLSLAVRLMGASLLFSLRLFCCAFAQFFRGGKRPFAGRYTASVVFFSRSFDSTGTCAVGSAYLALLSCAVFVLV